jgi:hypothetical protein
MTLPQILAVLAIAAIAWFTWDSLRVRETANRAMREACAAHGFLFLDDTVALVQVRPMRDGDGRLALRRTYDFDYSDTGHDRRSGRIAMLGDRVLSLEIPVAANQAKADPPPSPRGS